jgi:hypothetical protein
LRGIDCLSIREMRGGGSKCGQTGNDYTRNVALPVSLSDCDQFIEPAATQGGGGVMDESARLSAGSAIAIQTTADDENGVSQHEGEKANVRASEPIH